MYTSPCMPGDANVPATVQGDAHVAPGAHRVIPVLAQGDTCGSPGARWVMPAWPVQGDAHVDHPVRTG